MAFLRELTEEELLLIPNYHQFWYEIALSTTRLNLKQVQEAIENLYTFLGLRIPILHFCNNLYDLVGGSKSLLKEPSFCEDGLVFASQIMAQIHDLQIGFFESIGHWDLALTDQLSIIDGQGVEVKISNSLCQALINDLPSSFQGYETYICWVFPRIWYIDQISLLDFHFSAIQRTLFKEYDQLAWQVFQQLVQSSSWFIAFDSDCFICERPRAFSFKNDVASPSSILFRDGVRLKLD